MVLAVLTNPTEILLWRDLAIFLFIGALAGIALALLLIFKPHLLGRVNRAANRWISTRRINRFLERSISLEQWFYQHHRVAGIVVVSGAVYVFIYFGMLFDKAYALRHLNSRVLLTLLDALVLSALTGAAVALTVGLFLWLRPSLLRGVEVGANQWVSSRRATKVLDVPHDQMDRFVARHARLVGWLLLVSSIYLLFVLFRLLV